MKKSDARLLSPTSHMFQSLRNGKVQFVVFYDVKTSTYVSENRIPNSHVRDRGSVVSIATPYGLDGPGIESGWEAGFSSPFQTGPGAHPASYTMGTGSLPGDKAAGA
jgi:hypothetical protein